MLSLCMSWPIIYLDELKSQQQQTTRHFVAILAQDGKSEMIEPTSLPTRGNCTTVEALMRTFSFSTPRCRSSHKSFPTQPISSPNLLESNWKIVKSLMLLDYFLIREGKSVILLLQSPIPCVTLMQCHPFLMIAS